MASIHVWNHGPQAQKRPVQFTVPLSLGWGNLLEVGAERLIAEKQYDDGADAVYVCPAPPDGWPSNGTSVTDPMGTRTDYSVSAYSGPDPQYRFKFAEPFADDVCGGTPAYDYRFLPTLEVHGLAGRSSPLLLRPTEMLPWSQGPHPTNRLPVPNGGNRHRWFAASAHEGGWHLYFYIGFDSELAIAEFDAAVVHSDETETTTWTPQCARVVLRWPSTISVKPRFLADGIQREGGSESTMMLSTTFTSVTGTTNYYQWNYGNWGGIWQSQMGFGFSGFLLGRQRTNESTTFSDTEYANAETLHAHLDAETLDGHWLGGGSSGHGITLLNTAQEHPEYNPTEKHFWTWKRTGNASDARASGGTVRGIYPNTTGNQPGFGLVRGHDILRLACSPRDYEVGSLDNIRRPHYIWRNPSQRGTSQTGWYDNIPGLVMPNDTPILETTQGLPVGYLFGKSSGSPDNKRSDGQSNQNHSLYDQHSSFSHINAAFKLMKRPMIWHNMVLRFQWDELNSRRPNRASQGQGGADLTGSRAIGRRISFFAGAWEACPGLRPRAFDLMYNPQWGYYPCLKKLTGNSGLFMINLIDSDPANFPWPVDRMPNELPRDEATLPKWMRAPDIRTGVAYDGHVATPLRPSSFLYGPDPNTNYPRPPSDPAQTTRYFGAAEPGWEVVGVGGMLYWWHAIDKTSGGGYLDHNSAEVTDFKVWSETITENILKFGTARTASGNQRRLIGILLTYYSGQMLMSDTMRTPYPPGPGSGVAEFPHPFVVESHPLYIDCVTINGRAESSWHMGAINWYRQFGRNPVMRAEAQQWWNEMLTWVNSFGTNGAAVSNAYRGWYPVFFNAIAPLDLT